MIDEFEGGGYNVWSCNKGKIFGCNNDGDYCVKGWEYEYVFEYGLEIKVVEGIGCYDFVECVLE